MTTDSQIMQRFKRVRSEARNTRASLYHLTNECNLRCHGCWFFEKEFDTATREENSAEVLERFIQREALRGINAPLLIGGEPAMFPERIRLFKKYMDKVAVSTNGLKRIAMDGFEDLTIAISVFGGGPLDDELRAIGPTGKRFTGLFDKVLKNYKDDPRAGFVYAVTPKGISYIEDTVKRIRDNGNRLLFNYYSDYSDFDPQRADDEQRLLDVLLDLKARYNDTIASHPYYIKALITGKTAWGSFNYMSCPSISEDYAGHSKRFAEGGPALPKFNAYTADLKTVAQCCTSGDCSKCRDSQAVISWLLVNAKPMMNETDGLKTWVEVAESYFSQFIWSIYHPAHPNYVELGLPSAHEIPHSAATPSFINL